MLEEDVRASGNLEDAGNHSSHYGFKRKLLSQLYCAHKNAQMYHNGDTDNRCTHKLRLQKNKMGHATTIPHCGCKSELLSQSCNVHTQLKECTMHFTLESFAICTTGDTGKHVRTSADLESLVRAATIPQYGLENELLSYMTRRMW